VHQPARASRPVGICVRIAIREVISFAIQARVGRWVRLYPDRKPARSLDSGAAIAGWPRLVPGQSVGDLEVRPIVVGVVPVIGASGAVGGASVDAKGVVARSDVEELGRLRDLRQRAVEPKRAELQAASPLRKDSLARLQAALLARQKKGQGLTDELQCLAGPIRVRYVFVFPDQRDIVLAGPAEAWRIDEAGNAVGTGSGRPVLQLDDLVAALRTARAAADGRSAILPYFTKNAPWLFTARDTGA